MNPWRMTRLRLTEPQQTVSGVSTAHMGPASQTASSENMNKRWTSLEHQARAPDPEGGQLAGGGAIAASSYFSRNAEVALSG